MDKFALHQEAAEGDVDNVRQLIGEGVSVDSRDDMGRTPMHWAVLIERWYEMAQLLISNKCDLDLKDRDGRTAVMLAVKSYQKDVVRMLLQHGARSCCENEKKYTLLHLVSRNGWTDVVQRILDSGEADPNNAGNEHELTPLMMAAVGGQAEVVSTLIRAGADVNRKNRRMSTALHFAAFCGCTGTMQVLLGVEGLELNPQDLYGSTPLHVASCRVHIEVVKQLLKAGADTTLRNDQNETALSEGIRRRLLNIEEIRLFFDHGHFFEDAEFAGNGIYADLVLRERVLRDVDLCTQSIVNRFNQQSLPALYNIPHVARSLPPMKLMKLSDEQIRQVANFVSAEIKEKSCCNIVAPRPMVLQVLCVLALIKRQA